MTRVWSEYDFASQRHRIFVMRDTPQGPQAARFGPDGGLSWSDPIPDGEFVDLDPTFTVPAEWAQDIGRHLLGIDDEPPEKMMRKALEREQSRVDKMLDTLISTIHRSTRLRD